MAKVMPWTQAMRDLLSDGDWHDVEDVLKVGMNLIPEDRALEEMNKTSRSEQSTEERRVQAGRKTLSQQTLMSFKRFGTARFSSDKKRVIKTANESSQPGELVERVERLESQMSQLIAQMTAQGITIDLEVRESDAPGIGE